MRTTSNRRGRFAGMLGLVVAIAATSGVHAKGYMTADFKLNQTRPRTLAVLPPHADFIKAKAVMTDEMIDEALGLETSAIPSIIRTFEGLGYVVKEVTLDQLEKDPDLQEMVRRVNERFDEEWPKIVRRPKRVKMKRYSVGDESRELASMLEVDGLILSRIQGVYVTGGKKAMSFFFGGVMSSYARVDVTAVDGETGSVESYFVGVQTCKSKDLTRKPQKVMAQAYGRCLKKYPAEGVVLQVKKSELELASAEAEEDEDDEAVLGELEALLGADTESDQEEEKDEN